MPCSSVLDSDCSHTIVRARLCHTWSKRSIKIITINSETQTFCGVGVSEDSYDSGEFAKVNVLVIGKDILGFDLLLSRHWVVSSSYKLEECNSWRPQYVLHYLSISPIDARGSGLPPGNGRTMRHQPSYGTTSQSTPYSRMLGSHVNRSMMLG